MNQIFVVEAVTGKWDDEVVRQVRAFATLSEAKAFTNMANAWLVERGLHWTEERADVHGRYAAWATARSNKPSFDPDLEVDELTGALYRVYPLPFGPSNRLRLQRVR